MNTHILFLIIISYNGMVDVSSTEFSSLASCTEAVNSITAATDQLRLKSNVINKMSATCHAKRTR